VHSQDPLLRKSQALYESTKHADSLEAQVANSTKYEDELQSKWTPGRTEQCKAKAKTDDGWLARIGDRNVPSDQGRK